MPIAVDLTGETIPTNCRVTVLKLVVCSYFRKALLLPYALAGFDPQVKCAELKLYIQSCQCRVLEARHLPGIHWEG